jgi:hypothetical protein
MQALIRRIRLERRIGMRTYKDAKTMAKSLRESLTVRNVLLSHSECLEIVARVTGKGSCSIAYAADRKSRSAWMTS